MNASLHEEDCILKGIVNMAVFVLQGLVAVAVVTPVVEPLVFVFAVKAFNQLLALRVHLKGGLIAFDDYLWSLEERGRQDAYNMPKPAIDAFVNTFQRKVAVLNVEAPGKFEVSDVATLLAQAKAGV